jgi:hypothetical protein
MHTDIDKIAKGAFYLNPDMIKFLLVENLALKMILYKQGIIKPDEFAQVKKESTEIFERQANQKIQELKAQHPSVSELFKSHEEI